MIRTRRSFALAAVAAAFLLAHELPAQGPPAQSQGDAAILKLVDDHYNRLASLRAEFTEHYTGLGMDRTETGVVLLKKPGRMRWMYTEPAGKVFVLDGKFAWSYTPGDAQVQRVPAKQVDDLRSPLRFLLGHTRLSKELDGVSVSRNAGGYTITGLPKGMAQRVKQLLLDVAVDGRISRIRLDDLDGSSTEFSFRKPEENLTLPDSYFRYTPPAGVDVVEGLPPV